jgi:hypothetical protein
MRTLALAVLLLATACGRPLLFVEVEIPSAAVKVPQQAFPSTVSPSPADLCAPDPSWPTQPGNTCLRRSVVYDLGQDFRDLVASAETFELRLTRVGIALVATDPLADLGSIYRVRVLAEGVDASLPAVELARYVRDPLAPPSREIEVGASAGVDLAPYVEAGLLRIRSELEFDHDVAAFIADVSADFSLKVLVDWAK